MVCSSRTRCEATTYRYLSAFSRSVEASCTSGLLVELRFVIGGWVVDAERMVSPCLWVVAWGEVKNSESALEALFLLNRNQLNLGRVNGHVHFTDDVVRLQSQNCG